MQESTSTSPWGSESELSFARFFLAPIEDVFEAWTERDQLRKWWGPERFEMVGCDLDAEPGGTFRLAMRGPDGKVHTSQGTYLEVQRPTMLRFTEVLADDPEQIFVTTVTFKELGAMTRMDVTQTAARSASLAAGQTTGWLESLTRLSELLLPR
jgi:uncharacterized protein YndB with AHSA1/START domain